VSLRGAAGIEAVERVLTALAPGRVLAWADPARLVVGPSGAFVVLPHGPDGPDAGARAAALAEATRSTLAEHLAWVPFIDAVVATAGDGHCGPGATAVPLDLLPVVLVEGPPVIDAATLTRIAALVDAGLVPPWRTWTTGGGAKIDLCDPPQNATPVS